MGPQVYEIMEALHRARASSLDKPAGWGGSPAAGPADATALERASSGGRGGDRRGRRGAGAGGKPAMRGDSADGGASAGGMHSELPAGGGLVGGRLGGDGARGSAAAAARALLLAKLPWPPAAMHGPWQGSPKDVRITRLFVGETHLYQGSLSTDVSGFEGGFKPMSMHSCLCVCFCRHDCTTQVDAFVVYASWTAMAFCDCLWIVFF